MTEHNSYNAQLMANVLFAGLPLNCGPQVATEHLERVAQLGAAVLPHSEAITRALGEVADGVHAAKQESEASLSALEFARHPKLFAAIPFERNPDHDTFAYGLSEELLDAAAGLESQFGILDAERHSVALVILHNHLIGPNSRSLIECLDDLCGVEIHRWGIHDRWGQELRRRIENINVSSLTFGLHELRRAPWREYGGIVAGRVATPAYQSALRSLNRDVVVAHALHVWSWTLFTATSDKALAVIDLLETCVPFALPQALDAMLRAIGRLYMDQQFGAVVVLCRSALEVAMTIVNHSLGGEPGLNLATIVTTLARQGVLTTECARAARDLRIRGNKAVHVSSDIRN